MKSTMKKKSIVVLATLLVLTLGAGAAMAQMWGGCGMWGGPANGQYTSAAPYNCPMAGTPGNYYCPRTGNGYCPMVAAPGQYTQSGAAIDASGQYYPTTTYGSGWGCW